MWTILTLLFFSPGRLLRTRATLQAENLALRHQLLVLERSQHGRRPPSGECGSHPLGLVVTALARLAFCCRIVKPDTSLLGAAKASASIGAGRAVYVRADPVLLTTSAI